MRIDFFEEFPDGEALEQAALVEFPSTVFLAAESVAEYRTYRDRLARINPDLESGYWATLPESYWVSPFADPDELTALFSTAADLEDPVVLDLELPFHQPGLFFGNAASFFENRRAIREFVATGGSGVVTAEYPPVPILEWLYEPLGVSCASADGEHTRCPMYYSSMIPDAIAGPVGRAIERLVGREDRVAVGLGTIATGVVGDEPILSPADLASDLERVERAGATEVVIFRLGGLDADYLEAIEPYAD